MGNSSVLEQLRDISIRLQIDPKQSVGHAANLDSIIHVLTQIKKAYNNFLSIELPRKLENTNASSASIVDFLKKDLALIAVDISFSSFEIALAPNVIEKNQYLFSEHSMNLKKESFQSFKELIQGDFRELKYMNAIASKYSEVERGHIYSPIFKIFSSDYRVNIKGNDGKIVRTIVRPSKEKQLFYLPKPPKPSTTTINKTMLAYVDIEGEGSDITFNSKNIKKVHYFEELEHETYPFTLSRIERENFSVEFHEPLLCSVSFKDKSYSIQHEEMKVSVSADNRAQAEEAFILKVQGLYEKLYSATTKELSPPKRKVKEVLFRVAKNVQMVEVE